MRARRRGRAPQWVLVRLAACLAMLGVLLLSGAPPARADRWYQPPPVLGVVDAGRAPSVAKHAGATWDRALFLWQQIQPNGPNDWTLDGYISQANLQPTLRSDLPLVGIVQGTPAWADTDYHDGAAGVPTGLDLPIDDPHNTFGQFMQRLVQTYKGRISTWIIWNEPDFQPGESGTWWTWSGSASDFFRLLRVGYLAVKKVDPSATVVFPATTYYADAVHGRDLFLDRVLQAAHNDPDAARNGYYFDAVGVNLYCSLDVIYRVYSIYQAILARYEQTKPIWLTETNCPVYNDATTPMAPTGRITTDEQAAYLIQAVALARAAGYQRIGWYSMVDHDASSGIVDRWGLLRSDGSPRPALRAFEVAEDYLARPDVSVELAPLGTPDFNGWPVDRVILDDPAHHTRVQVLWRTAAGPSRVVVGQAGTAAQVIDPLGFSAPATRTDGGWQVWLPPPRVPQPTDPPGFQTVSYPVLLVETGVSAAPLQAIAQVTSPLMALAPAVVPVVAALPPLPVAAKPLAGSGAGSAAALPAITQPGPSLVVSLSNPQPGDLLSRGKVVMQGQAFDRAAASGSGVDRVSVFVDNRDSGGQHVGDATLGQPAPTDFTVTADLSHVSGGHTLFVYARSAVTGHEAVLSFPITVR